MRRLKMTIVNTMSKSEFVKRSKIYPLFKSWTQEALEALYEELKLSKEYIEFDPATIKRIWVYHRNSIEFDSKLAWTLRHYYAIPNLKEEIVAKSVKAYYIRANCNIHCGEQLICKYIDCGEELTVGVYPPRQLEPRNPPLANYKEEK
jgi:hypothetical protein